MECQVLGIPVTVAINVTSIDIGQKELGWGFPGVHFHMLIQTSGLARVMLITA